MKILRVDTYTNFNFTDKEFEQLDKLSQSKPDYKIFVGSNSFVEIKGEYPCIVTINPHLDKFVEPKGKISLIKAARVKYVANPRPLVKKAFDESVKWCKANNIPILITFMRFRKEETLKKYCNSRMGYVWAKNYFRQSKRAISPDYFYCDLKEKGCPDCMNCTKLTYGVDKADIFSVNLSSSGECKFNCPDCYVKNNMCHHGYIKMDKIVQNNKLSGAEDYKRYKYGQRILSFDTFAKFTEGKKMKYKIIVDNGKPYDIEVNSDEELESELVKLKDMAVSDEYPHFDVIVLNDKDEDISESQFIVEMIGSIMEMDN